MKDIPYPGASRQTQLDPPDEQQPSPTRLLKKRRRTVVLGSFGPGCPRCGRATKVIRHAQIGPKQLRQPFYFERWFRCTNNNCRTKNIMDPKYRRWNDNERARELQMRMNRSRQNYGW
jgi:hypothetical protein